VPVASVIARTLGFVVDLIMVKKIGHPRYKEYAIGAVSLEDSFVLYHPEVSEMYVQEEIEYIRRQLRAKYQSLMGDHPPVSPKDKTVILVDDGIATGHTMRAAIRMLRKQRPEMIVLAAPVASAAAIRELSKEADAIQCPLIPPSFKAVGQFYKRFTQMSDEEVKELVDELSKEGLIAQ
jgi:predicted phosphoribosyltransferase